jgi:sulfate transport system ATP-binding protein
VQDRTIGFVFQHYALFRHMTVRDNIAFGLSVRKRPREEIDRTVEELLSLVQLADYGDRYPSQLSGGQRQRVALARALAPRPSLLLLDEPFGALDAKVRVELREWIRKLHKERGITSVFVTHDQEEAMDLADRVVVLHRGKVEQIGTPEQIYDHPATEFVASFVGSINVLRGEVKDGRAALGSLAVHAPPGTGDGASVRAFVRPHDIELTAARGSGLEQAARPQRRARTGAEARGRRHGGHRAHRAAVARGLDGEDRAPPGRRSAARGRAHQGPGRGAGALRGRPRAGEPARGEDLRPGLRDLKACSL